MAGLSGDGVHMGAEQAVHPELLHGLGGLLAATRTGGQRGAATGPASNYRKLGVRLPERRLHEELARREDGAAKTQRSCGHRATAGIPSARKGAAGNTGVRGP